MIEGQPILAEVDASRFRGEFLDCCSQIEDHAGNALIRLVELGMLKKSPHLFGQKFQRLIEHVETPRVWKHPVHVKQVLEDLRPYAAMRSAVCHAVMSNDTIEGGNGVSWRMPGEVGWEKRKALTQSEMIDILSELRRLTGKLRKQPLLEI